MKYIAFIVGLVLLFLIGAFVWNVVSTTISDSDFGLVNNTSSEEDSDDVVVFEEEANESNSDTVEEDNPETVEEVPVSQREGVVTISSVRRSSSYSRPQEISLSSRLEEGEALSITGWKIVTNDNSITIPSGVNFYRIPGSNSEGDIIVNRNDRIKIYFETSPISDNLRLNQCTGYLNEKYDLENEFPNNCPRIDKSLFRHLSGSCQDYINSINGDCVTPDSNVINSFPGGPEGNACREFLLEHFNSGYCFSSNQDNNDFLDDEWRVWIDKRDVLDPEHDWVRLYNREGILIDERDY